MILIANGYFYAWLVDHRPFFLFYLSVAYGHRDTTVLMHVMGPKLLVLKVRETVVATFI